MKTQQSARGSELDWEAMQAALQRYCLALTGSSWEAQDLSQTAWTKALERLRGRGHVNPEAYLLRIAKNAWIDVCRRKAAYKELLEGLLFIDREDKEDALEMEEVFRALIKHLSPLQRTVFVLREALGYSIAETAVGLGTTEGAVKAALHRARQAMGEVRQELGRNEGMLAVEFVEEDKLRTAVRALQEGQVQVLVSLLYEQGRWRNDVHAMGWFQASTPRAVQGLSSSNAMYLGMTA
ncbi:RNA polymerase sigma factor [Paenibacillus soyae]|uniref:RNA polymerase sigma factor n=1 Tax=Paenibacillus soyae TaxID=2969249 RepID=A0A9X2S8N6_9BACL|nr:RNA polymerase sigma factor [Paenibacillus soyae]MCR2804559.1 RNA polymerase sigma factor [Paenibacillus soyae]